MPECDLTLGGIAQLTGKQVSVLEDVKGPRTIQMMCMCTLSRACVRPASRSGQRNNSRARPLQQTLKGDKILQQVISLQTLNVQEPALSMVRRTARGLCRT